MEQERSISDPDLGTGGEGDGLSSSGIPRSIKSLQKCHDSSDLTQHFSQPGVTDCPTPCPGPNDLPSLVACCSIGCQEDSTSSCIRCLTTPVNFHMPLSITQGLCLHVSPPSSPPGTAAARTPSTSPSMPAPACSGVSCSWEGLLSQWLFGSLLQRI